jgi:hypothetical protein
MRVIVIVLIYNAQDSSSIVLIIYQDREWSNCPISPEIITSECLASCSELFLAFTLTFKKINPKIHPLNNSEPNL